MRDRGRLGAPGLIMVLLAAVALDLPLQGQAQQSAAQHDEVLTRQTADAPAVARSVSFARQWWGQPGAAETAGPAATSMKLPATVTNVPGGAVQPVVAAAPQADDINR